MNPNAGTCNAIYWLHHNANYMRELARLLEQGTQLGANAAQTMALRHLGKETPDGMSLLDRRIEWEAVANWPPGQEAERSPFSRPVPEKR